MAERQPTTLGFLLMKLMGERQIRPHALARAAGIAGSTLSRIMYGEHRPDLRTLHRIAEALGIPVEELAGPTLDMTTSVPAPVLLELDQMLHPESSLTNDERRDLATSLDQIAGSYREAMRRPG